MGFEFSFSKETVTLELRNQWSTGVKGPETRIVMKFCWFCPGYNIAPKLCCQWLVTIKKGNTKYLFYSAGFGFRVWYSCQLILFE